MGSSIIPYIERMMDGGYDFPSEGDYQHEIVPVKNPVEVASLTERNGVNAHYSKCSTEDGLIIGVGGTPETRALYLALLGDDFEIRPSRLHVGSPRRKDTRVAMYHVFQVLSQIPETQNFLEEPYEGIGVVGILRASEGLGVIEALGDHIGYHHFPYDMVKAYHIKADNAIGREVKVYPSGLEGFPKDEITRLIAVDDGIASGVTQGTVFKDLLESMPNVNSVLFLNVFASLRGSIPLLSYCHDIGVPAVIACMGPLLESDEQLYYSPLPCDEPCRFPDKRDIELHKIIWGDRVNEVGVGGNWTALWYSPCEALRDLE